MHDRVVCAKVIDYDAASLDDASYVSGRRLALKQELEFLTLSSPLLPEPIDWLIVPESPTGKGAEPILVYTYQPGQTLHAFVTSRHPRGLEPQRALDFIAELARFAQSIHEQGWIFRDFDPRHVLIGLDDVIHLVGCGNAVRRQEKLNVFKMHTSTSYTAPEIRRELSGKVVRPACDVYSLGALLSFLLTGIEPMERPESPLDPDAFDWLQQSAPEGLRLLIARCLQPLAQKRFARASDLIPYCDMDTLPHPSDEDFGMVMLPTPWSGPEGMDNRALRSKLSAGPLLSEKGGERAQASPQHGAIKTANTAVEERAAGEDQPVTKSTRFSAVLMVGALIFALLIIGVVVGSIVLFALGA